MSALLSFLKKNILAIFALGFSIGSIGYLAGSETKFGFSGLIAQPYTIQSQTSGSVATTTAFFGDVIPQVDNLYSLGSITKRWKTVFAGTISASSTSFGGDLLPDVDAVRNIGSASLNWNNIHSTGTSVFGGALTVTNGVGTGADRVQVGYEQSPAKVPGDTYRGTSPLNIYAATPGFVDAFTMTAGGNGADGACFSAKNLGASLGRQCQTSSPLGYWIMALNGLAFHSGNLTPYGPANVDLMLRGGNVGIGLSSIKLPTAKLEVQGTVSSTKMVVGNLVGVPGSTTDLAVVSPRSTSTVQIGGGTSAGCFVIRDTDVSGDTFCTALNGTLSCSTTDCR